MDHALEDELITIAQKIRTDAESLLAKQKKRTLNAVSLARQDKQKLEMPLHRKQLKAYFNRARQKPGQTVSALAFQQAFIADLEPTIWLACVMNECLRQHNKSFRMEMLRINNPRPFSGNIKVKDIILSFPEKQA